LIKKIVTYTIFLVLLVLSLINLNYAITITCPSTGQEYSSIEECDSGCVITGECSNKKNDFLCTNTGQVYDTEAECNSNCVQDNQCQIVVHKHYKCNVTGKIYDSAGQCQQECELTGECANVTYNTNQYSCDITGESFSDITECQQKCVGTGSCLPTDYKVEKFICNIDGKTYNDPQECYNNCKTNEECVNNCEIGQPNPATGKCEVALSCDSYNGYTYDNTSGNCVSDIQCPNGNIDTTTQKCEWQATYSCASSSYQVDTDNLICSSQPQCDGQYYQYSQTIHKCEEDSQWFCPQDANLVDSSTGKKCKYEAQCPAGTIKDISSQKCVLKYCPDGYNYKSDDHTCFKTTTKVSTCPDGYEKSSDGTKCIKTSDADVSCPDGYVLTDTGDALTCIKGVDYAEKCPDGGYQDATSIGYPDLCYVYVDVICPTGENNPNDYFDNNTGKCIN
jgi:hypothetical protein